jgi:hypothetical protein
MNSGIISVILAALVFAATVLPAAAQEGQVTSQKSIASADDFSPQTSEETDKDTLEKTSVNNDFASNNVNRFKFDKGKVKSEAGISDLIQSQSSESQAEPQKPKRNFRRTAGFFGFYGEGIKTSDSQLRNYFGLNDDFKSAFGFANSTLIRFTENVGVLIDTSNSYVRKRNVSLRSGSFNSSNARIRANISQSRYDILAGPQYTFANKSRIQPFVYGLAGVELNYQKADAGETLGKRKDLYANFAMAFGGGFDVPVNKLISIRPLQIDYKPVFQRERTDFLDTGGRIEERRLDQTRIAFGIVLNL